MLRTMSKLKVHKIVGMHIADQNTHFVGTPIQFAMTEAMLTIYLYY